MATQHIEDYHNQRAGNAYLANHHGMAEGFEHWSLELFTWDPKQTLEEDFGLQKFCSTGFLHLLCRAANLLHVSSNIFTSHGQKWPNKKMVSAWKLRPLQPVRWMDQHPNSIPPCHEFSTRFCQRRTSVLCESCQMPWHFTSKRTSIIGWWRGWLEPCYGFY